jgi:hypothetical protein
MRSVIVAVLFLSVAVGWAQDGPFTLLTDVSSSAVMADAYVAAHDSTADVIFRWRGNLMYLQANTEQGAVAVAPILLREGNPNWQMTVPAMIPLGWGWAAIIYELGATSNRTWYLSGHDTLHADTSVAFDNNYCTGSEYLCYASLKLCHALAPANKDTSCLVWVDEWTTVQPWGFQEGGWSSACFQSSLSGLTGTMYSDEMVSNTRAMQAQFLAADCVLVLSEEYDNLVELDFFVQWSLPTINPYQQEELVWLCPGGILSNWLLTHSGHSFLLLRAVNDTTTGRLVELTDDGCEERFPLERDLIACASHPDYGMAWISVGDGSLLLYRADTTGTLRAAGIFAPIGEGYTVGGCALSLSDNGRLVLVWSENSDNGTLYSRLRMATLGWDTPLDVPHSSFTPHPSSFTLSAYPNPFNSELRINYSLPQAGDIELAAYNVLGQKAAVVYSGTQAAGAHTAHWSPQIAGGVYFVSLRTEQTSRAVKILYLK